jgi:hypothetical protein
MSDPSFNYCGRVLRWLTKRRLEQQGEKTITSCACGRRVVT